MRLLIANIISVLVHLGVLGGMAYWIPRTDLVQAEFVLVRGEPITASFSLPSAAEEQQVEVELEAESVEPAEPAPPVAVEAAEIKPSEQALPDIDAVPTERPFERPPEVALAATEPLALPPELSETEVELEPATGPKSTSQEQPLEAPTEKAEPKPRKLKPAELAQQQSVAMPFQQAVQVGVKVDQMPRKLPANAPPNYPVQALLSGIEGRVMLRVLVDATGLVENATVQASSGTVSLDEAALAAVRRWRFSPARRAGTAVAHEVLVPVRFSILGN